MADSGRDWMVYDRDAVRRQLQNIVGDLEVARQRIKDGACYLTNTAPEANQAAEFLEAAITTIVNYYSVTRPLACLNKAPPPMTWAFVTRAALVKDWQDLQSLITFGVNDQEFRAGMREACRALSVAINNLTIVSEATR